MWNITLINGNTQVKTVQYALTWISSFASSESDVIFVSDEDAWLGSEESPSFSSEVMDNNVLFKAIMIFNVWSFIITKGKLKTR